MNRAARGDDGQAAVELALVLPVIVLMALGLLQVAVLGRDQLQLESGSREAARAAAVAADPSGAAAATAHRSVGHPSLHVTTSLDARTVTVRLERSATVVVPFVGRLFDGVTLRATTSMALEPPDDG